MSSKENLGFVHRYEPGSSGDTLLVLHGTGGDESDLIPLARRLTPDDNLLSPRGQVLEDGMPRFFRRLDIGVFDEADLVRRAADLGRFVRAASKEYGFEPRRVRALGYSNGANTAAALLLLDPDLLSGAVLLRAVLPLTPPRPPDLSGTRVLIAAGRRDPYAPVGRVEALQTLLRDSGADVDLRWSDRGHELAPEELDQAAAWLEGHPQGR